MGKKTKRVEDVKRELIDLNDRFHNKKFLTDEFYKQLIQMDFLYEQCILISIFPDGSDTYCGQIIRQDSRIYEFDIDLDSAEYSTWKDVTKTFCQFCDKNKIARPWLKEIVAYSTFNRLTHKPEP